MMDMIAPLFLAQMQELRLTRLWLVVGRAWPLALLAVMIGVPALAHAQTVSGGASPQTMINNVCTFILGPFGQTIAVLGIIGGIVIMFGASYLGQTLTGGG